MLWSRGPSDCEASPRELTRSQPGGADRASSATRTLLTSELRCSVGMMGRCQKGQWAADPSLGRSSPCCSGQHLRNATADSKPRIMRHEALSRYKRGRHLSQEATEDWVALKIARGSDRQNSAKATECWHDLQKCVVKLTLDACYTKPFELSSATSHQGPTVRCPLAATLDLFIKRSCRYEAAGS